MRVVLANRTLRTAICCLQPFRPTRLFLIWFSLAFTSVFAASGSQQTVVDAFTTSDRPVVRTIPGSASRPFSGYAVTAYEIDGIQTLERSLSRGLPSDRDRSEQLAIQRLHDLSDKERRLLRASATGLAKATHYGIDRLPAVVFDSEAVVYGITDIPAAIAVYETWHSDRRKP